MTILFSTFDVFPSAKGSGTHIACKINALKDIFGSLHLASLGTGDMPRYQEEDGITIRRCVPSQKNFLKKTEDFSLFLEDMVNRMDPVPGTVHFRDIWSAFPLIRHPRLKRSLKVFEVNGLPSVELPYHYPAMLGKRGLMSRISAMEDYCLHNSDYIMTVSGVTRAYLVSRSVKPEKISVLENTAININPRSGNFRKSPAYILYTGTLTPWQGLPVLIKAFGLIAHKEDISLCIACSNNKNLRVLLRMIGKMGLKGRVDVKIALDRESVYELYRNALFSAAPLQACARNLIQGCSPLKIIESMAMGAPVIASRIPVCAEIIGHGKDGWLVAPGSPRALALGMERLLNDRGLLKSLGAAAAAKAGDKFGFNIWKDRLEVIYKNFTGMGVAVNG